MTESPTPSPPADAASTAQDIVQAELAAAAHASDASTAILRAFAHALLWAVGGGGLLVVSDSLFDNIAQRVPVLIPAIVIAMVLLGFHLGLRATSKRRLATTAILGGAVGWFIGLAIDRIGGAILTAPIAGLAALIIAWIIDLLVPRVPSLWRLRSIWSAWASLIAIIVLAALIRLVIGRVDDDDLAFFALACLGAIVWARQAGWMIDGDLSSWNFLARARGVLRIAAHPRLLPFVIAIIAAGIIAGPFMSHLDVQENEAGMTITTDPISHVWPGAIMLAALAALATTIRTPAPTFRKAMALLMAVCLYLIIDQAVLSARFTDQEVVMRSWLLSSARFERGSVVKITYARRTGRRSVSYDPVIHLADGSQVTLSSHHVASSAVDWMKKKWNVEEVSWRDTRY